MAVHWKHYILPRRELAAAMLRRAQRDGAVAADADLDVPIDMMAGAVTCRALQPDPPDAAGDAALPHRRPPAGRPVPVRAGRLTPQPVQRETGVPFTCRRHALLH
ncbi:TetR/AcrR family transcriptional regulator C-terminal ligand-binding domain-containing protein [Nonomuraea sp. CA-218870]|uniref:TetR/AcrR family transcriptional regulator C-terminal ligand-binding domain-containing protein n=1 Tax=Nonomuraea sp. CA-218870 TaxID=3239998 RepID=UPI003D8B59F2